MLNIVLFGPPGAGKGTQSAKLINKYGLVHLSTGDIFRANIKGGTELGNLAKSYIDKGQLVPDEVTIKMLESECSKTPKAKGFIFDGFPRTQAQAKALDKFLKSKETGITMMLALEVDEEELKKRLLLRGKDSGRADDQNPEVIQKRIDVYNAETMPVKDYYSAQGKYKGVNGIGTIDTIFNALCDIIDAGTKLAKAASAGKKPAKPAMKKTVVKKKAAKPAAKKSTSKSAKKVATKKKAVKKVVKPTAKKKTAPKVKVVKKAATKKAVKKTVVKKVAAKKTTKKVVIKKATVKAKSSKKVAAKKAAAKSKSSNKRVAVKAKTSVRKKKK